MSSSTLVQNADTDMVAVLVQKTRAAGQRALDEPAGKKILSAYGVDIPKSVVVSSDDDVVSALRPLIAPFAVKIIASGILHKSDAGGVKVGLQTAADVELAVKDMAARPELSAAVIGYLIEEMAPDGIEIVIGGVHDANFGPVIMFGLGGIFVEVFADVAFRICPITDVDANEMIDEIKGSSILTGLRGAKPVSRDAIVDVLLKIGGQDGLLLEHIGTFEEIDINPLIVSEHSAVAVDARFILS